MYIVTGGAGFIGSNIVNGLEAEGLGNIAIIDKLCGDSKWRNVAKRELFNIVRPDQTIEFLNTYAGSIRAVIHMGAISSTTEKNVDLIVENNFSFSIKLWEWCTSQKVRFIYASSAATYGNGSAGFDDDNKPEALSSLKPLNAYGWSKHLFDRRIISIVNGGGPRPPQWVGLKFFNVYGPNEYHKDLQQSLVAQIYPYAQKGGAAKLFRSHNPNYEDGGQLRDFIWVDDCVNIVLWFLENENASGLFNCGTGKARSFADLAVSVYQALGLTPTIEYIDTPDSIRNTYQYFTEAKIDRLRAAGYKKPMTDLEKGVAKYIHHYLDTDDPYR
ncbi:MAG: ADP-glyceromanno-heptose 6-epimerase [Magnetovibrio sp.]|nr:ADP-glyceromanno-heptose 6-epimerase [Magnetovibrio sp.]|tara:strand:- start:436 stop:1422 length:987 start_codon:yes stop_codon:yes gene_type:complete